jgi:Raf kinase inhibitor-like YbhB/YbcL family protein
MEVQMKYVLIAALSLLSLSAWAEFKVTSKTISEGGKMADEQVFNGFGCSGGNVSPDLSWSGAPKGTKYFAVTAYDPDAPTGSGWWHWEVINIPAKTTSLAKGASGKFSGETIEPRTDFGKSGYGGPCPPPGKPHHYIFKVYALKDKIALDKDAPGAQVGFYANSLKLGEASITATYGR